MYKFGGIALETALTGLISPPPFCKVSPSALVEITTGTASALTWKETLLPRRFKLDAPLLPPSSKSKNDQVEPKLKPIR